MNSLQLTIFFANILYILTSRKFTSSKITMNLLSWLLRSIYLRNFTFQSQIYLSFWLSRIRYLFLQIYYDFSLPIVNSLSWSRFLINCFCREFIIHLYILIKIYSYRICYRINSRIDFYLTFLWPQMTFEKPFIFCLTLNSYSPFSFGSNSTQNLCIMLSIHDLTYIRPQYDPERPFYTGNYSIWPRNGFLHQIWRRNICIMQVLW